MKKLDVSALENWLWEAACMIRGPLDAPKFKDYILPLIFLKRLSDVFDDEICAPGTRVRHAKKAAKLVEQDHKLVRFFIPRESPLGGSPRRPTAWASSSPTPSGPSPARTRGSQGVIDVTDFNATTAGQRISTTGASPRWSRS